MEYLDWLSHVLVGVVAAVLGVLAQRAGARRRWRRAPAALLNEAVLAVCLVNSTELASHHGDGVAMRARNLLERRTLRSPPLDGDYVTCLAQSPTNAQTLAFGTRRREVYLTADGGASWRRISEDESGAQGSGVGATDRKEKLE